MSYEIRANYSQSLLFPPSLEDWIAADHPARLIRTIVDQLDLRDWALKYGSRRRRAAELCGGPVTEGMAVRLPGADTEFAETGEGVPSARGAAVADGDELSGSQLAVAVLAGQSQGAQGSYFEQTVKLALRTGLVDMAVHAVDGTKITSRGSTHTVWNRKRLQKLEKELEGRVAEAMKEVDQAEASESGEYRLPEELSDALKLRETVREQLAEMAKEERDHMNPSEPDARMMKNHEGTRMSYNAQVVADGKAGIIVAPEVTTEANDKLQLTRCSIE